MIKIKKIVKVRIVYKNGYTHDFWVHDFKVKNDVYYWRPYTIENAPVVIGTSEIVSVWQIGIKRVLEWS